MRMGRTTRLALNRNHDLRSTRIFRVSGLGLWKYADRQALSRAPEERTTVATGSLRSPVGTITQRSAPREGRTKQPMNGKTCPQFRKSVRGGWVDLAREPLVCCAQPCHLRPPRHDCQAAACQDRKLSGKSGIVMDTTFMFASMLARFLGGWEIILIMAVLLLLFGARYLPGLARGLGEEFGGAAGRPVVEALTHWNESAEDTAQLPFHPKSRMKEMANKFILFFAQGFGLGRMLFAPGTWGSVLGVGWFLLLLEFRNEGVFIAGTVLASGFAVWICGEAERVLGQRDPPSDRKSTRLNSSH